MRLAARLTAFLMLALPLGTACVPAPERPAPRVETPPLVPPPSPSPSPSPSLLAADSLDPEEYAVYAALVEPQPLPSGAVVLVGERTTGESLGTEKFSRVLSNLRPGDSRAPKLASLSAETIADAVAKNTRSFTLGPHLTLSVPYRLLPDSALDELVEDCRRGMASPTPGKPFIMSTAFRARYPDSEFVYRFSRVGFDTSKVQAVVYFEARGVCFGAGDLFFLVRRGGTWIIEDRIYRWIT